MLREQERVESRPQRTMTGTSVLNAQTRATTQPIMVHPRKKFRSTIEAVSRLLRAKATMEGRKYITKPKPKNGNRKNAETAIALTSCRAIQRHSMVMQRCYEPPVSSVPPPSF